jgi:hypothetical protein
MIPGALAAIAVVLTLDREDWRRRVAYFGMFGALGWSFGGSISYMQVIAYTHSGHSASVLYGFACLFVIGFLWAALGGAGTAIPALFDADRIGELFWPMTSVFAVWALQELAIESWLYRRHFQLNWFDTDWLGALGAIIAVIPFVVLRRSVDRGVALILALAVGWWISFLFLVVLLGIRMTPPRGDNWAGCLGMFIGLVVYCWRHREVRLARFALISGFIGGIGFAAASMLKLVEITSGSDTNWHSILEQTTGLFNGVGIAVAMVVLDRENPPAVPAIATRRWTEPYAVGFVLVLVTYLNLRKSVGTWVQQHAVPALLHGLPAAWWFNLVYAFLALAIVIPLFRHLKRPLPLIPTSALGRGQWFYLVFLWWMVVGNFERALTGFTQQRLVTEGVIFANAALCTLLILLWPGVSRVDGENVNERAGIGVGRVVAIGVVAAALSVVADWAIVRTLYGDRFAGYAGKHIRFGPNATTKSRAN